VETSGTERKDGEAGLITPRMILSCSWRTLKEAAHFMSRSLQLFLEHLPRESCVLVGDCLVDVLRCVKHRAAFEQVYASFETISSRLWRSSDRVLARQPEVWLNELLSAIEAGDTAELCTTRRGAGIPFIIQAVVSTEPPVNASSSLKRTMAVLLPIAEKHYHPGLIHAMNILRALFCDADLREPVSPYVEAGMQLAVSSSNL
jgi:hypothetical protein